MNNRNNRRQLTPMQIGSNINQQTGEIEDYEFNDDYTEQAPVPADRLAPDGSRIVDKNFKRDLAQYRGMGAGIKSNATQDEIFDIIAGRMGKVAAYDGIPTRPLKEYVGRTFRIVGAIISGKDSFSSKEFGELLEGYDVLKLKINEVKKEGKWSAFTDEDRKYIILHTGASQPMKLFEAAFEAGFPAGDFPEGKSLEYCVSSNGNEILIGPIG